ncbi:hypothetical protein ACJIZ3_003117 [Penstemon smallii]|uniref:DUF6821 domain-containing protein n=1 Tax=Penstemon smallii TaxID=265156 RepID=A0ABD3U8B1_9LAMI
MDIVEASNEFTDWEVLHNSDSESTPVINNTVVSDNPFDEIDSEGLIQVNYFSSDPQNRRYVEELDDDNKSAESDNPSWIDPGSEENPTRYLNKDSGEFWSDSTSDRSDNQKFSGLEGREVNFDGIGDIIENNTDSSGAELGSVKVDDSDVGVGGNVNLHDESEVLAEEKNENEGKVIKKRSGEIEKRGLVWWKMPMEFLKYCLFRMSPVWTVSVAAAVMGFVILGRRLYTMKKKAKGLQIKVTIDDKKVSQVMSRAARLNEAFSVVKRVPVIRPSLPAVGVSTWPVMSLR